MVQCNLLSRIPSFSCQSASLILQLLLSELPRPSCTSAAQGLPLLCTALADVYRLVAEQPASSLQLPDDAVTEFEDLIGWLQLSVVAAQDDHHTVANGLALARCVAESGKTLD